MDKAGLDESYICVIPIASKATAMLFAVYIPPQEPLYRVLLQYKRRLLYQHHRDADPPRGRGVLRGHNLLLSGLRGPGGADGGGGGHGGNTNTLTMAATFQTCTGARCV